MKKRYLLIGIGMSFLLLVGCGKTEAKIEQAPKKASLTAEILQKKPEMIGSSPCYIGDASTIKKQLFNEYSDTPGIAVVGKVTATESILIQERNFKVPQTKITLLVTKVLTQSGKGLENKKITILESAGYDKQTNELHLSEGTMPTEKNTDVAYVIGKGTDYIKEEHYFPSYGARSTFIKQGNTYKIKKPVDVENYKVKRDYGADSKKENEALNKEMNELIEKNK